MRPRLRLPCPGAHLAVFAAAKTLQAMTTAQVLHPNRVTLRGTEKPSRRGVGRKLSPGQVAQEWFRGATFFAFTSFHNGICRTDECFRLVPGKGSFLGVELFDRERRNRT